MEKGKDYDQNISPTPRIAIARIMTSIAAAYDFKLHLKLSSMIFSFIFLMIWSFMLENNRPLHHFQHSSAHLSPSNTPQITRIYITHAALDQQC
jgi:hypothetical protein